MISSEKNIVKGPADVLDHATSEIAMGTKLGIDATRSSPMKDSKDRTVVNPNERSCGSENWRAIKGKQLVASDLKQNEIAGKLASNVL